MVNLVKKESRRVKQLGLTEEKISKLEGKWKEIIQNVAFRREEIWSLPTQQPRLCTTLWSRASARATRWPRTWAHWAIAVSLTEHTKFVWDRIWEVLGFASYKQSALGLLKVSKGKQAKLIKKWMGIHICDKRKQGELSNVLAAMKAVATDWTPCLPTLCLIKPL